MSLVATYTAIDKYNQKVKELDEHKTLNENSHSSERKLAWLQSFVSIYNGVMSKK